MSYVYRWINICEQKKCDKINVVYWNRTWKLETNIKYKWGKNIIENTLAIFFYTNNCDIIKNY